MNESGEDGEQVVVLSIETDGDDDELLKETFADVKLVNALYIVSSGDEALDFIHQRGDYADSPHPDLVLLDPEVPGMPGTEILRKLNEEPEFWRVPVIVISSSEDKEDIGRSYDLHANAYIRKPSDPNEFVKALHAIEDFWFRIVRLPPEPDEEDDQRIVG